MKQQTLVMAVDQGSGFEHYRKPTRRDESLKTMQAIVPHGNGRPPVGLERVLRIHFILHWFKLANSGLGRQWLMAKVRP